ncbi:3-hydroxyacyl-ACP dehydratase FabZ [Fructilactobacillus sanfranciscensis]|uniref:3-hydroxyacyl-[acyl-carrier-protein] dehydratase FabZ n=2 Tax=Fructilactobacillus sanfranciscensis TaxID=1625 RepID=G2KWQ4_FRUST|nr:3-hydroxyacyl-ACP dehydratase FabZ [Fructilactobacillus sanfranciscensis]AEN99579.1 (3R)-hydroxymyristoyl-[acyl-carrier-protein]dehyd ratase [Fructilactobacillus sanfranciscensis TMW 1.1304]KRM80215.1 (3R)-hydroxymyristoyl-ACP dehydratase [Fructilactobacillus sanfranciscensis DSM 20451]MCG7194912.1 3-hydroxyacyl-ACP dehydratase FabZ [Fructilactobacillus sanfranciscensis]MCG7196058.1 3-hydroxyacyl-ACP dehydratase FabZ [Fructilactobacillus sanfranciscensis]MDN4462017.1 3-hydroxyacyl-ACP dehyd
MAVMNAKEIMDLIPNRYPILFIDRVDEMVPGESIVATKNVTINEEYFQGHFPGNPVMPGVLIIESMAQVASILILKTPQFENKTAYLGSIKNAKFRRMVEPGDVLTFKVTMDKIRDRTGSVSCVAYVGDEKCCETKLTFIVDKNERTK